jgi:hypothetical protein
MHSPSGLTPVLPKSTVYLKSEREKVLTSSLTPKVEEFMKKYAAVNLSTFL